MTTTTLEQILERWDASDRDDALEELQEACEDMHRLARGDVSHSEPGAQEEAADAVMGRIDTAFNVLTRVRETNAA